MVKTIICIILMLSITSIITAFALCSCSFHNNNYMNDNYVIAEVDNKSTVLFELLPEDYNYLNGQMLVYYVFFYVNSKPIPWCRLHYINRYQEYDFNPLHEIFNPRLPRYSFGWNYLHGSAERDLDPVQLMFPATEGLEVAYLFMRASTPKNLYDIEYYIPDQSTQFAYRFFSEEDIQLFHSSGRRSITFSDLNLEFRNETEMLQDEMLYSMALSVFSHPEYYNRTYNEIPESKDFSAEYVRIRNEEIRMSEELYQQMKSLADLSFAVSNRSFDFDADWEQKQKKEHFFAEKDIKEYSDRIKSLHCDSM